MIQGDPPGVDVTVTFPDLMPGQYSVALYDTVAGAVIERRTLRSSGSSLRIGGLQVRKDLAVAIRHDREG